MAILPPREFVIDTETQFEIPPGPLDDFRPEQIIYRQLTFDCTLMQYAYTYYDKSTKRDDEDYDEIKNFVKRIAKNKYPKNDDEDKKEDKILDIKLSWDAYVVIGLDPDSKWTFSSKNPAVTLGKPHNADKPPAGYYADLWYVDDKGDAYDHPKPGCRVAYFSAKRQAGDYAQPLNFNINTRDGTAIVVDPDIRFPGNGTS